MQGNSGTPQDNGQPLQMGRRRTNPKGRKTRGAPITMIPFTAFAMLCNGRTAMHLSEPRGNHVDHQQTAEQRLHKQKLDPKQDPDKEQSRVQRRLPFGLLKRNPKVAHMMQRAPTKCKNANQSQSTCLAKVEKAPEDVFGAGELSTQSRARIH